MPKWDIVSDEWFDHHDPPVYVPVACYQAVCDHCGDRVTDYGGWIAVTPEWSLWEWLPDWQHLDGRDLCPCCWYYDDNDVVVEVGEWYVSS